MSSWAILLDCGAGFSEMQWQSIVIHVNLSPPFVVGLQAWFGSTPSKVHCTCTHYFFTFYYNYRHSTYNPMRYIYFTFTAARGLTSSWWNCPGGSRKLILLGPVPERRNNSIPGINVPYFRDNFIPGINSVPERRNNAIKGINLG